MRFDRVGKIAFAASVFMTVAAGSASAAGCSNASLSGVYGSLGTGYISSTLPGAGLFQFNADGAGNLAGTGTESGNGTIAKLTITGKYAIAKNCTGTVSFTDQNNQTSHYAIVLDAAKKGFQVIGTDSGQILAGYGLAQGAGVCGLTGKKDVFAENSSGTVIGLGPVAIVAQVILNGKGKVSGSATLDENGTVVTEKLSGTYTANSDCTGTATVKAGVGTSNFATVTVNGGKELLLIETDASTVFAGNMQQ